jgi:hypothetical protein
VPPALPPPASVVTAPLSRLRLRTRLLPVSAMYSVALPSVTRPRGFLKSDALPTPSA